MNALIVETMQCIYDRLNSSPGQNGCNFADDILKCIFIDGMFCISIQISLKFVPRGPINNIPVLG